MSKICIFLADGFEEIEGLTVVDLLRRAGEEVVMVSIMGRREITGSHKIQIMADALYEEMDFSEAKMLVLPGGMPGTKHLGEYEPLTSLLTQWNEKGKMIAAICAAPSVLGELGILSGREAVCYPGFEEKLTGAIPGKKVVAEDGNIITSRGLGTAIDFASSLIEHLQGKEKAEEIKKSIIYGLF
ncbi:MAG: DJ-1/PfpI family protein [Clostridia bacterium]|nr:DJ-1/PfpI family protein [Clostridia bacterium]NCC43180.1 DJ-1/PfpI family protein [Clostridia bacterium]